MKIKSIQVLTGVGTDQVSLNLDAETPFPKMSGRYGVIGGDGDTGEGDVYEAYANVEVQRGYGIEWAAKHFPHTPITKIDGSTGEKTAVTVGTPKGSVRRVDFTEAEWSMSVAVLIHLADGLPVSPERIDEIRQLLVKVRDDAEDLEG